MLPTITAAWPADFSYCFASRKSIMSPAANIEGWFLIWRVGRTLTYPRFVKTSGWRNLSKDVFGPAPRAVTCFEITCQTKRSASLKDRSY